MLRTESRPRAPLTGVAVSAALGLIVTLGVTPAAGQGTPTTGPVVADFGPVFEVPEAEFPLDPEANYWAVFDVAQSEGDPAERNRRLESAARYLNMHARSGVDPRRMRVALVVHGGAGKDLLDDGAYRERHGVGNPNTALLTALDQAGVEIYLCGQTAAARNLPADSLAGPVTMALSAMTVLVALQNDGYRLIAF
jgi:intracellular sulfur oxidation DsrE/DsrF family protein